MLDTFDKWAVMCWTGEGGPLCKTAKSSVAAQQLELFLITA